jgi:hypothetical protein
MANGKEIEEGFRKAVAETVSQSIFGIVVSTLGGIFGPIGGLAAKKGALSDPTLEIQASKRHPPEPPPKKR